MLKNGRFTFLSKIQNWPFFDQKRPKFGHFWPKNSISLSFDLILTPNFLICYFLYEILLVQYFFLYFRMSCCPCDQYFGPFRGSCCVKITKNGSKSTFLELFDLVMTENLVYFLFSYKICIVNC